MMEQEKDDPGMFDGLGPLFFFMAVWSVIGVVLLVGLAAG